MRKNDLIIANFICTFGAHRVLLDFIHEIVTPAFFRDTLVRSHGDTSYYIYQPSWINFKKADGEDDLAICGRFVKDTILKRQQILQDGHLVDSYDEMESAPSSFFVLLLSDHRLLYFGETQYAPDIGAFSSTMQIFMRRVWRELLKVEHDSIEGGPTYKALKSVYPMPILNIIPVAKTDEIGALMASFSKIEKIKFRLIKPNDETDVSEVLQSVRDRLQPLNPSRLDLVVSDSEGLDKAESIAAVQEAAEGLNTDIVVSGKDELGNRAKADNHEFALRIPVDDPPENDDANLAKRLYKEFIKQVSAGNAKRPEIVEGVKAVVGSLKNLVL